MSQDTIIAIEFEKISDGSKALKYPICLLEYYLDAYNNRDNVQKIIEIFDKEFEGYNFSSPVNSIIRNFSRWIGFNARATDKYLLSGPEFTDQFDDLIEKHYDNKSFVENLYNFKEFIVDSWKDRKHFYYIHPKILELMVNLISQGQKMIILSGEETEIIVTDIMTNNGFVIDEQFRVVVGNKEKLPDAVKVICEDDYFIDISNFLQDQNLKLNSCADMTFINNIS